MQVFHLQVGTNSLFWTGRLPLILNGFASAGILVNWATGLTLLASRRLVSDTWAGSFFFLFSWGTGMDGLVNLISTLISTYVVRCFRQKKPTGSFLGHS